MAEHINKTDTLNEGRVKLNAAISDAESARVTAEGADVKSTQALANSVDTQTQLDTVVIEGDSSVEAAQARVDELGEGHATLKARIDDGFERTSSQLAETGKRIDLLGAIKYGQIDVDKIVADLGYSPLIHNMTFKLYRGVDGVVRHTYDLDDRIKEWDVYYIDGKNGIQSNDGKTRENPKQNIDITIAEIEENSSVTSARLLILGDFIDRNRSTIAINKPISKNYSIEAENDHIYMGPIEVGLNWTSHSSGVYKANRTATVAVFDDKVKDIYDLPTKYEEVASLTECESTRGTWYTNGSVVYVHTLDRKIPIDGEIFVIVEATTLQLQFADDKLFVMKNITILSNNEGRPAYFGSTASTMGHIILDNVTVHSSKGNANGIETDNLKSAWIFNGKALDVARDGFNYHATRGGHCFVFEYNCFAENCGVNDVTDINNATTAHEGIHILRVGSKGINTKGPVLADVAGCHSFCIDCNMDDSLIENDEAYNKAGFFFEDNSTSDGWAVLINCGGGDRHTKGISCGTSFKEEGKIAIQNFHGSNIPNDIDFDII